MAFFCNKCNSPIEDGNYFCPECGSNDIREDSIVSNSEELNTIQNVQEGIPEIETNIVNSFGEKSIEQLQNSNVQSISNQPEQINTSTNQPTETIIQQEATTIPLEEINNQETITKNRIDYMKNNRIKTKRKKNTTLKIILSIIGIIALAFLFYLVYSYGKESGQISLNNNPKNPEEFDYTKYFNEENSFRIGNKESGYISVPKTWAQVEQPKGSTVRQYTDGTDWVITLMSTDSTKYSAVDYANNIYDSIKKSGGNDIKTGKTRLAGYNALTITATYPKQNKYLSTWFFESKNGQTRYLAIEGPEQNSEYYNIIYSFRDDK